MSGRHRYAEERVRAEPALGRSAVELDQFPIEGALIEFDAGDGLGDLPIHIGDGFQHALPEITLFVAVAKLERFSLACGRARWDGGAAERPARKPDLHFDGRVPARIQNFSSMHAGDFQKLSPVVFGFDAERFVADGLNKRVIVFGDDDDSEVGYGVSLSIFFEVESDDRASGNEHIAVDDGATNPRVATDTDSRHENASVRSSHSCALARWDKERFPRRGCRK